MLKLADDNWEKVSSRALFRILEEAQVSESRVKMFMNKHYLDSHFLSSKTSDSILFDFPVVRADMQIPPIGENITVSWLRDKDGYHYRFVAAFLGTVSDAGDGMKAIGVAFPEMLERTQRRHSCRVHVPLEDAQNFFLYWGNPPQCEAHPVFAHDLSISGGRLSFTTPLGFLDIPDLESVVGLTMCIDNETFNVEGRVIRIEKSGTPNDHSSGRERWMLGLHFINRFHIFQETLEKYLVEQQYNGLRTS